jgi:hypothetical protein
MPLLMTAGMVGSGLFAGLALLLLPASLFGIGSYSIDGRQVSASEFWRMGGGPLFVFVSLWLGAVAIGFRRERTWARPLAASFWFATTAIAPLMKRSAPSDRLWDQVVLPCLFGVFAIWYFYRKRSVVTYYAALQGEEAPPPVSEKAGA